MKARWWMTTGALVLLGLAGHAAHAQITAANAAPMKVLIRFNDNVDAWDLASRIASATGMQLLGTSASTRSAAFIVTNETNYATGRVASANQQFIMSQFPGAVATYNYGQNLVTPADLQLTQPNGQYGQYGQNGSDGRRRGYGRNRASRFTDSDRQAAIDWYNQSRNVSSRLQVGAVLDQDLRARSVPAPIELERRLTPAPTGSRYVMIGGALVLLDNRDYVQDIIRFDGTR